MALDLAFLENAGPVVHAKDYRRLLMYLHQGGGVTRAGDLDVTQRGAGANMSVDVAIGYGLVFDDSFLGLWPVMNDTVANLTIAAADPTNGRIDRVVARVQDSEYAGGTDLKTLEVVTGVASATPVAPALPARSLELAQVSVPAGATSITNARITEKRFWTPDSAKARGAVAAPAATTATSVASATFVSIGGATVTFNAEAGRLYRMSLTGRIHVDTDGCIPQLRLECPSGTAVNPLIDVPFVAVGHGYTYAGTAWATFTGSGSLTARARIARAAGAGTATYEANGIWLVEDIGGVAIP